MENNINVIVVLLFMTGVLVGAVMSLSAKQGAMRMKRLLCVGGKWLQMGSLRFWQRKTCVQRRQEGPTHDPSGVTQKATTVDFDQILPSLEAGPPRGRPEYNPHYGYEPYWPEGDWVYDREKHDRDGTKYMCGIRCPKVYTEYGKVCGRNKNYVYKTFENYCQLRNMDCSNVQRWMVLYRGACYRNIEKYYYWNGVKRTRDHIQKFLDTYKAASYVGFCDPCPAQFA